MFAMIFISSVFFRVEPIIINHTFSENLQSFILHKHIVNKNDSIFDFFCNRKFPFSFDRHQINNFGWFIERWCNICLADIQIESYISFSLAIYLVSYTVCLYNLPLNFTIIIIILPDLKCLYGACMCLCRSVIVALILWWWFLYGFR